MARLLGPTGGYLLSFPVAAALTGFLAERGFARRYLTQVLAMTAGLGVILLGGVMRLAYGPPVPLGLPAAFLAGVAPFLAADVVKITVGATLLPVLSRYVTSQGSSSDETT